MSSEIDFFDMYANLGVEPDCDLEQFKLAYRRCVASMHPDRSGNVQNARIAERLRRTTQQYGKAMAFHRQHGRLPGARPAARRTDHTQDAQDHLVTPVAVHAPVHTPVPAPHRSNRTLIVLGGVVLLALVWQFATVDPAPPNAVDGGANDVDTAMSQASSPIILLGVSTDGVRSIEGNPTIVNGDQWMYGPSWVRFREGAVVDWYSAPERPLHTAGARPASWRN